MALYEHLLAGAHRLGHALEPVPQRAEDRGPDDDWDGLFPVEGFSFAGATDWIGSAPLSGEDLRGRVVLVHFWSSATISSLRSLPHVQGWVSAYGGRLAVVGVHSPEFAFEQCLDDLRQAAQEQGISWPVAVDPHFEVWRSFRNAVWPAFYLVDATGRLRHHSFGEDAYDEVETQLRALLGESGAAVGLRSQPVGACGAAASADWAALRTVDTHFGYARSDGFASPGGVVHDTAATYELPPHLRLGQWALDGTWAVDAERATSHVAGGRLSFRFHARDLHLVAAPAARGSSVRFRVTLDGRPPEEHRGSDVDGSGNGSIGRPRLYSLVRQQGVVQHSTVDVELLDPGAELYAATFG
jgi:thiol-disulfide isomerase/thioredoxin